MTTNGVRVEECDYVSHTVLPDAAPLRFRHNGSASVGMWKASELSYVLLSVGQLDRAAECHLGN
ncbi:MAG: hypothetical protein GWN58_13955, partial [Anaerolineae bacterium]|nr:hypothetical protein [Anaerolineae bacterium]